MKYRREIDGLRAVAVLPVILFHAGFDLFSGGYIGVDIFFVISGYLITSIILNEKQNGQWSLLKFYERRVRRILPALFFVMICCVPFALASMLPSQLIEFGESIFSVLFFVSNVFFWRETGYFDLSAELKPLLHTWSLAVEEQFYLFFPLLIMLIWPLGMRLLSAIIALAVLASFGISEWGWQNYPSANFFLSPSRAWELCIGALCAIYLLDKEKPNGNQILSICGIILILFSIFTFNDGTPFPSRYTLVPVLGTCLIILFAAQGTYVAKLLSLRVIVGAGLISYSTYLWHLPLFAFVRMNEVATPTTLAILVAVAFLCGYISWKYIEAPFRSKCKISLKFLFVPIGSAVALLGGTAFVLISTDGLIDRYPASDRALALVNKSDIERYLGSRFNEFRNKEFVDDGRSKILVVGDSFAQDIVNSIFESSVIDQIQISTKGIPEQCGNLYLSTDFLNDISPADRPYCQNNGWYESDDMLRRMKQADVVFVASSWQRSWQVGLLSKSLNNISGHTDAKILVAGTKNFGPINVRKLLKTDVENRLKIRNNIRQKNMETNVRMKEIVPKGMFIDTQSLMCESDTTCPIFTDKAELISRDGSHLTQAGAVYLGARLVLHGLIPIPPSN